VKDISLEDYRALAEFRYQIRSFLRFSEEQARSYGLEPQQHQLMLAVKGLRQERRATIRELAGRLHLKHHSTVELVDRLEARGAVVRTQGLEDRREVIVELTRSGEAVLRKLSLAHHEELQRKGPALIRALNAIVRASRKHDVKLQLLTHGFGETGNS